MEAAGDCTELGVDGAENGVRIHHDLVSSEGDQGPARHGVVGHEDGDLARVSLEGIGDLGSREH